MRYKRDYDDLFYYDGFTNPEDIFDWIFKFEDTLEDILKDKHVEYMSSKLMEHASQR